MIEVSQSRIHILRAMYLFIVIGLVATIWPRLLDQPAGWPLMNSVVVAMLATVSLLALAGLRYPLRLIPVLLFELLWKAIWLGAVALPRWLSGGLDEQMTVTAGECLLGVVLIPLVLPWRYVVSAYLTGPGTPWRVSRSSALGSVAASR